MLLIDNQNTSFRVGMALSAIPPDLCGRKKNAGVTPRFSETNSAIGQLFNQFLSVHGNQEFLIVAGALHLALQEFHGLHGVHVAHELAENPDAL